MITQNKILEIVAKVRETGEAQSIGDVTINAFRKEGKWNYTAVYESETETKTVAEATSADSLAKELLKWAKENQVALNEGSDDNTHVNKEVTMNESETATNEAPVETQVAASTEATVVENPQWEEVPASEIEAEKKAAETAVQTAESLGRRVRTTKLEQSMHACVTESSEKTGFTFSVKRSDEVRYARALFDLYSGNTLIRKGLTVTEVELVLDCFTDIVLGQKAEVEAGTKAA